MHHICLYVLFSVPVHPPTPSSFCNEDSAACTDTCLTVEWPPFSEYVGYDNYYLTWRVFQSGFVCPECFARIGRYDTREYKICNLEPSTSYEIALYTEVGTELFGARSEGPLGSVNLVIQTGTIVVLILSSKQVP